MMVRKQLITLKERAEETTQNLETAGRPGAALRT